VPGESGKEEVYKLRPGTRHEYREGGLPSGKKLPTTPPQVIVVEGESRSVFEPEMDAKGNYLCRKRAASMRRGG